MTLGDDLKKITRHPRYRGLSLFSVDFSVEVNLKDEAYPRRGDYCFSSFDLDALTSLSLKHLEAERRENAYQQVQADLRDGRALPAPELR